VAEDLTSTRPYLLRAMHEWMSDNGQTPLLVVDALHESVQVPDDFVEDGHIVLNISWSATRGLKLDNDFISFEARFAGAPRVISLPVAAVKGIYARESGQGMMFQDEPTAGQSAADPDSGNDNDDGDNGPTPRRPGLRVVK